MLSRQHNPFAGALVVLLYYYCYLQMYFTYNIEQSSEPTKENVSIRAWLDTFFYGFNWNGWRLKKSVLKKLFFIFLFGILVTKCSNSEIFNKMTKKTIIDWIGIININRRRIIKSQKVE